MTTMKGGRGQKWRQRATLVPLTETAKELGKVYILREGDVLEVEATIRVEDYTEGWRTGLALDASSSMQAAFGRGLLAKKALPDSKRREYEHKGWIRTVQRDGQQVNEWQPEAYDDAIKNGYLEWSRNIVEPEVRRFVHYLASELDTAGSTQVIYWACGKAGKDVELLEDGDVSVDSAASVAINGPKKYSFGDGTKLLPAIRILVDGFVDAPKTMLVFLTDGRLDDLQDVKDYTCRLAKEISKGRHNLVKCVLLGLGPSVDETQLVELDDLETGTDIDIWDHKLIADMRDLSEIMVELVDENRELAPRAQILDDQGQVVRDYTDGLPPTVSFSMPPKAKFFELQVGDRRIRQNLSSK